MSYHHPKCPLVLSIGIMASNEETTILSCLSSLFRQSVFEGLMGRGERCEILVVAHACTDRTAAVVREYFFRMEHEHEWSAAFTTQVVEIAEPGRSNAWNRFVHEFSSIEARY